MAASLAVDPFNRLPDELLLAVCQLLPPPATAAVAQTNRRFHGIVADALHWRRRCLQTWRYWAAAHDLPARTAAPPLSVPWRALHDARHATDERARAVFEALLTTQRGRLHRIEDLAAFAYDAKDLLLRARDTTPDDADDVLARRFFADAVLGRVHRAKAVDIWTRLQRDGNQVPLEQALGAYDLFLLSARHGDLSDIAQELDRLAQAVTGANVYIWATRSIRQKAVAVAEYLRAQRLVGNPDSDEYHNLRNSFLSLALFREPHTSLPLQSVAIYCAVAQRLGLDAQPSNYPQHVHAVIRAPAGLTLDGEARRVPTAAPPERMYMDPWNTADEVPAARLDAALRQMGVPPHQIPALMAETSTLEIARRTGRNIMHSVQLTLGRRATGPRPAPWPQPQQPPADAVLDYEAAIYAFMWKMMLLGDASAGFSGEALARGREVGPSLLQQMQVHFPEDMGLVERTLLPLCSGSSEGEGHAEAAAGEAADDDNDGDDEHLRSMAHDLARLRAKDLAPIPPRPRDEQTRETVRHRVGDTFVHARYGYQGFVTGWDARCTMPEEWIENMGVDELPRGRDQPFYHVVADDKSVRYVAEENMRPLTQELSPVLLATAGRFFKRWDPAAGRFVSNLTEQYPDD